MIGPLIAAGASILGSVLGNNAAKKQAQAQYEHQKEFAQSGIQWKVQDAEKAGIHPLYALGANTTSYQPTSVGGTDFGIPDAGQNIGRAIDATRASPEQSAALKLTAAQIDGVNLDNELKKTQLASALRLAQQSQTSIPGPFDQRFIEGQGNSPTDKIVEPEYLSHAHVGPRPEVIPSPLYSNAQTFEDRYGEMSDYVHGPRNMWADYVHNFDPAYDLPGSILFKDYGPYRRK